MRKFDCEWSLSSKPNSFSIELCFLDLDSTIDRSCDCGFSLTVMIDCNLHVFTYLHKNINVFNMLKTEFHLVKASSMASLSEKGL